MKQLLPALLITLLAFGTACGQAAEPEPVASNGIQVHGHWTITVTDPDGTVDAVHEFDNELMQDGKMMLVKLLAGSQSVYDSDYDSQWAIAISSDKKPGVFHDIYIPDIGDSVVCQEETLKGGAYIWLPASFAVTSDLYSLDLTAICTVTEVHDSPFISLVRTDTSLLDPSGGVPIKFMLTGHYFDADQYIKIEENQTLAFNIRISFS